MRFMGSMSVMLNKMYKTMELRGAEGICLKHDKLC